MSKKGKNSNSPKNPPPVPKEKPQKSEPKDPYTRPPQVLRRSHDPDDTQKINK